MTRSDPPDAPAPAKPESRPAPTRLREGERILDLETYVPFLLNATSSAWQRRSAPVYRARFGIGIVEWRVISMLKIEPGITARRICQVIRMDKSAASRALSDLEGKGLVRAKSVPGSDPRQRRWSLSPEGSALHDEAMAVALEHEAVLTRDIPEEEFRAFLRVIRRMLHNLDPSD